MDVQNNTNTTTNYKTTEEYESDVDKALAEVYEAFFPNHQPTPTQPNPQPTQQNSIILAHPPATTLTEAEHQLQMEETQKVILWQEKQLRHQRYLQQLQHVNGHFLIPQHPLKACRTYTGAPRKKRRADKKIDRTLMVTAAGLPTMDKWAWRKYGQKPIKYSIFPRSYYKCTSVRGCNAKKHVEKCMVEPEAYFVTYTQGHNHPDPVRSIGLATQFISGLIGPIPVQGNGPYYDLPLLPPPHPMEAPLVELPPLPEVQELPAPMDEVSVQFTPLPEVMSPPPEAASLEGFPVEEEEEGLLIPSMMVMDDDMYRGMQELQNWNGWVMSFGNGSGLGSSGSSGSGFY